jgi:hypothetical protein
MKENGWIGVDFDGTLAYYDGYTQGEVGEPIMPMINRVRRWLAEGKTVKVMTARASGDNPTPDILAIQKFCQEHLGQSLDVTCIKDQGMEELWDDRAVRVIKNTGLISDGSDVPEPIIDEAGDIGAVM